MKQKRWKKWLFIIGLIVVALNLRPAITSVGPIIQDIRSDTGVSNGVAGMLTTVPLLAFAILSPFAPKWGRKLGNERAIWVGLWILGVGIVIRPFASISFLFIGTVLVGAGVAIINVLLPGIVKRRFPAKIGLMTGVYSMSMGLAASLGSGLSVPMSQQLHLGWENGLRFWVIIVIIGLLVWLPQLSKGTTSSHLLKESSTVKSSLWRSKLAWQVTLFMGLQSLLFYCMISWLPEILSSRGTDLITAGWLVAGMQLIGLPATLLAPALADRLSNQKGIVYVIGLCSFIGIGILFIDVQSIWLLGLSVLMMGVAFGASISMALTFISLRTRTAEQAANLSGMAQSIGYLLAASGPFMLGFLYDWFVSWDVALLVLLAASIAMLIIGVGAGQAKYVLDEENEKKTVSGI
ncbi:CynX/NimT family MFS transporter [Halalkalibacter hemicellulosilyticus]|uniref:Cyanate MFS transporter n=1 Tax=Halalkalibacter hemicellulosilyticusJCM 9152 TaxID=1236971 RepID=W4QDE5_9BACI|nr:MFS transporter [Halalkalibacter hemicellulosilyticus]GAE29947.1 cyanate MFS transporter [Halalkalibacter hemicellulosilyticusJCM 9152]